MFKHSNDTPAIYFEKTCDGKEICIFSGQPCIRKVDCGVHPDKVEVKDRDLKIFVAWSGTDSSSAPMRSNGLLPSKFRKYSFDQYYVLVTRIFE